MWRSATFRAICLQGLFGSSAWAALPYLTLWLELACFSNARAAAIYAGFTAGSACGSLVGGALLDAASRASPERAPVWLAQLSVFAGIPGLAVVLYGLPPGRHAPLFALVLFAMGSTMTWCQIINNTVFSAIMPPSRYDAVFALDSVFEGVFGAIGSPAVGFIADRYFGYSRDVSSCSPSDANALGSGLMIFCSATFTVAGVLYGVLHFSYPAELRRAREREIDAALIKAPLLPAGGAGADRKAARAEP